MPTPHPVAWHPSFASAFRLELAPFKGGLHFETEHELNAQPLRIDLLVVRKDPHLHIDLDIAAMFRGHNILEFKSEQDGLNFDDLCKVVAYGCLYKAYGTPEGPVELEDVTLTLVRRGHPNGLFASLKNHGYHTESSAQGVYQVRGLMFPVQVIVTGELDPAQHVWLASLTSNLETMQARRLVQAATALQDEQDRILVDSIMNAVTLANNNVIERLLEEDGMYKTLREIMGPKFDEELAQARLEAATKAAAEAGAAGMAKGMAKGIEQGMEQGREEGLERGKKAAIRATVERLLRRGGFSNEEVAELAGTTVSEVCQIAETLGPAAM